MTNKFRASYTILSTWASGDWEKAIKIYFKLEQFESEAMRQGKAFHEAWEKEVKETKCLPKIFGGKKLNNPITEQKIVVPLHDWLDLVGVIDCLDSPVIYEYKTGKSKDSEAYANDIQTGIYSVLATVSGIYVNRAEIYHLDQYKKSTDMSVVHLTDKVLENSLNYIETISTEMYDYFNQNKLFEKFGSK